MQTYEAPSAIGLKPAGRPTRAVDQKLAWDLDTTNKRRQSSNRDHDGVLSLVEKAYDKLLTQRSRSDAKTHLKKNVLRLHLE